MTEENNNQPATPPINYEEHLDWFRVFVFIILPIQFIGNLHVLYQHIINFNNYYTGYVIMVLFASIVTFISIGVVFIASIKQKPIGYKVIRFYSIFIIIYQIIYFIVEINLLNRLTITNPSLAEEVTTNYLTTDFFTTLVYIAIAIINLIYFSHRKFLFGIPDEKSIPPESKEE